MIHTHIYIYILAGKGWDLTAQKMGSEAPLRRDGTKQLLGGSQATKVAGFPNDNRELTIQ